MRYIGILACVLAALYATQASAQTSMPEAILGNAKVKATPTVRLDSSGLEKGTNTNPDLTRIAVATSTACVVSATSTATTPTGCTSTGSAGTYIVGPFTAQAGYPVRLVTTGTWTGSIAVGTSIDSCATVNALTVAGQSWGTFTGNANEAVDVPPTTGSVKYCLSITVSSGTITAALRQ